MFCNNCGKPNSDGSNFCVYCGNRIMVVEDIPNFSIPSVNLEPNEVTSDEVMQINSKMCLDIKPDTILSLEGNEYSIKDEISIQDVADGIENTAEDSIEFIVPEDKLFYYRAGENAYAECVGIKNGYYHFYCIDRLSNFFWNQDIVDRLGLNIQEGDYVWVNLEELKDAENYTYRAIFVRERDSTLPTELVNFEKYHDVGDILYAPVVDVDRTFFAVGIGSVATVRVPFTSLPHYVEASKIRKNTIRRFRVTSINVNAESKVFIKFSLDEKQFEQDERRWEELPKNIIDQNSVYVYSNMFDNLKENDYVCKELFKDNEVSITTLRNILNEKYQEAYENRLINVRSSKECMHMEYYLGIRDEKGVPQSACFKRNKGNNAWGLHMVGFSNAECMFERYVYIPNWYLLLNELSDIALGGEEWSYNKNDSEDKSILKQYLLFAFYKSWLDGLLYEDEDVAIFNTGLVDSSYDDIFCYLKKNSCGDDFYKRAWEYGYFACIGKGNNGKEIYQKFANFPNAPSYVRDKGISDLYFNPDDDLYCDYEHIIKDNLKRLPIEFIKSRLLNDPDVARAIEYYERVPSKVTLNRIIGLVNSEGDRGNILRGNLQNAIETAVVTARKYCKWNYKTAIPIYYPRSNSISFLLPLKLHTKNNVQADVALVVERVEEHGRYQGQTILTLAMAYQDARQICRPNSEWLNIHNIMAINGDRITESESDN